MYMQTVLAWLRQRDSLHVAILLGWGLSAAACLEAAVQWRLKTQNEMPHVLGVCALASQEYGTHNVADLAGVSVHVVHGSLDTRVPVSNVCMYVCMYVYINLRWRGGEFWCVHVMLMR